MKATAIESPRSLLSGSLNAPEERQNIAVRVVEDANSAVPPHPLGIKPSGNQYTTAVNSRHSIGVFQMLPDEFLQSLLEYLDARLLQALGSTCKALYAFCSSDELWRALFIEYVIFHLSSFIAFVVVYGQL